MNHPSRLQRAANTMLTRALRNGHRVRGTEGLREESEERHER
jgi:hypothetical protein